MSADEFRAWFSLVYTPGLSRQAARGLLQAFGSPEAVLGASQARWAAVAGREAAQALATPDPVALQRLAHAQAWLAGQPGRQVVTLGDAGYPEALLHCGDPPLMFFLEGRAEFLQRPSVAVVGSRQATAQGLSDARQFAHVLSLAGVTVVSGLAAGIDGAAHDGALGGSGSTVAVVGTGLDIVYPRRHASLMRRIVEAGAVISEYAPGTPVLAHHFPHRNRLIAGLTRATLVVEATLKSGSLITARLAAESGREVFAVPGSIHCAQASGCHALIRQGAMLVESAQEVLQALNLGDSTRAEQPAASTPAPAQGGMTHLQAQLLQALGYAPTSLDTLSGRTGWPAPELSARLLDLELQGLVARLPGGLYQRQQAA